MALMLSGMRVMAPSTGAALVEAGRAAGGFALWHC